jgi:hypothetical protein
MARLVPTALILGLLAYSTVQLVGAQSAPITFAASTDVPVTLSNVKGRQSNADECRPARNALQMDLPELADIAVDPTLAECSSETVAVVLENGPEGRWIWNPGEGLLYERF